MNEVTNGVTSPVLQTQKQTGGKVVPRFHPAPVSSDPTAGRPTGLENGRPTGNWDFDPAETELGNEVGLVTQWARDQKSEYEYLKYCRENANDDDETRFARADRFIAERYGIDTTRGAIFNQLTPDAANKPFKDPGALEMVLQNLVTRGYESIASDEYRALREADAIEDEEQRNAAVDKLAGIAPTRRETDMELDPYVDAMSPMRPQKEVAKTPKDLADERNAYRLKIYSENFVDLFERFRPELSEDGERIVRDFVKDGSLSTDNEYFFGKIMEEDPEQGELVSFLCKRSQAMERDLAGDAGRGMGAVLDDIFGGAGEKIGQGLYRMRAGFEAMDDAWAGSSSERLGRMTRDERDEYNRLRADGLDEKAALDKVAPLVQRRKMDELMATDERIRRRRAELAVSDLAAKRQWEHYGYWDTAFIGAASTIPYIAFTAIPYAGYALNVMSHMQNVEDDIVREGGDPTKAKAARAIGAMVWAGIEKMELKGFGKTLTTIEKTAMWRHLWQGEMRLAIGELGAASKKTLPEMLTRWGSETGQEMLQDAWQRVETDLGLDRKAMETLRGAYDAARKSAYESSGTMAILTVLGPVGVAAARIPFQKRRLYDRESVMEFISRKEQFRNMLAGLPQMEPETDAMKRARVKRAYNELSGVWANAKSPTEAMRAFEELGYTREQAVQAAEYFDAQAELKRQASGVVRDAESRLREIDSMLETETDERKRAKLLDEAASLERTLSAAYGQAKTAGNAFRIGKDTTWDAKGFFELVQPGATVTTEDVVSPDGVAGAPREVEEAEEAHAGEQVAQARVDELATQVEQAQYLAKNGRTAKEKSRAHKILVGVKKALKKARRRLEEAKARAEAAKAPEAPASQKVTKVTRTVKDANGNDHTTTVTVVEDTSVPDVHSTGYAQSMENTMRGAVGEKVNDVVVKDGRTISTDAFKALDLPSKMAYAVTKDQWLAMTDEEMDAYAAFHDAKEGGNYNPVRRPFRILDEAGSEVFTSDGLITIKRADSAHTRKGGNYTLAHEDSHYVTAVARALGVFGDPKTGLDADGRVNARVAVMRKAFGEATDTNELWNEEAMADAYRDYLRGKYDFHGLGMTHDEKTILQEVFAAITRFIRGAFRRVLGRDLPPTEGEVKSLDDAREAAFQAIQNGDFRGLDAFAGTTFKDEARASSAPPGSANAQNAQKPPSAASGTETANPAPAASEAHAEAPAPVSVDAAASEAEERVNAARRAANPRPTAPEQTPTEAPPDAAPNVAELTNAAVDAAEASPASSAARHPVRTGTKRTVFTPGYEMSVEADAMWVPLADLVESTDDREVQMRDRSRVATDEQVLSKTRKGVFQPLALFPGTKSDDGAPIVGGGLRIISGHGRKRMLDQLLAEGRYAEYLDAVNAEAARQGMPQAPVGMENPVLVLRVTGGLDKREDLTRFAELSNRWGGLERSGAEHAESDARKVTDALLRLYSPDASGNLLAASNRAFMAAFLKEVGATGLTNADGTPTAEAALRVQRAMMTAIFGNDDDVRAMVQCLLERNQELSLATLQNALVKSAGKLLAMKMKRGSFDIVGDVRQAAYQYIAWRQEQQKQPKLTLADHLNQSDFFTSAVPPVQQALAKLLEAGRFGAALDKYAELVAQQSTDDQSSLFGESFKRTPLQLVCYAERATLPLKDGVTQARSDEDYAEPPVTPNPESAEAKAAPPPPVVAVQPPPPPKPVAKPVAKPATPKATSAKGDPVTTAQKVIDAAKGEPFVPRPHVTRRIKSPNATETRAFTVLNGKTHQKEGTRIIPGGVWNLLHDAATNWQEMGESEQDKTGHGLWSAEYRWGEADKARRDALLREWGGRCPIYMGNKNDMTSRTVEAIYDQMSPEERASYTALNDCFGGGGCWGLTLAMTCFPNVRSLVVNEYEECRVEKIRLLHTIDGRMEEELRKMIAERDVEGKICRRAKEIEASGKKFFNSGTEIAQAGYAAMKDEIATMPRETQGLLFALLDALQAKMANGVDYSGETRRYDFKKTFDSAVNTVIRDAKRATEMAEAFKARGGTITYVSGDAKNQTSFGAKLDADGVYRRGASGADFAVRHGADVVSVTYPPYYRTTGYGLDGGNSTVGFETNPSGWGYKDTERLLAGIVDLGDANVYTDEAWWLNKGYDPRLSDTDLGQMAFDFGPQDEVASYAQENGVLGAIVGMFDHFDVAGRVASRQEVLGVNHGHTRERADEQPELGENRREDEHGSAGGVRRSVRRGAGPVLEAGLGMDGGNAREDEAVGRGDDRRHRPGRGELALAREVIVSDIAASLEKAAPGAPALAPSSLSFLDNLARHSVSQVRADRLSDYCAYVSAHAPAWFEADVALPDGALPIPPEMRADQSLADVRHSISHGDYMRDNAEYRAVYAQWHNPDGSAKPGYLRAPNGQPTKLTEEQWNLVRTPAFKAWFGDWEAASKLRAIDSLPPLAITERPHGESVEQAYASLGEGVNATDGRRVRFVNSTLGKIIRHKGFDTGRIVHQLKDIFEASIPVASEPEKEIARPDGTVHKRHPNFVGYHTYLGKITDGTDTYYVRVTVQEEKTRQKDYNPNAVHSTFVSDVAIYNDGKALSQSTTTVGESELSRTDGILAQILADLNGKARISSKVVDENGEPLVVYHGTNNDKTRQKWDDKTKQYIVTHEKFWTFRSEQNYFNSSKDNAGGYGNTIYDTYLNLSNPLIIDCNNSDYDTIPYDGKRYGSYEIGELAKEKGFDGVILKNIRDGADLGFMQNATTDYIAFSPTQIKSATDNTGAFSATNPDIRYSVSPEKIRPATDEEYAKVIEKNGELKDVDIELGTWILPDGRVPMPEWWDFMGRKCILHSSVFYLLDRPERETLDDQMEYGYADTLSGGAIRLKLTGCGIEFGAKPTEAQTDKLADYIYAAYERMKDRGEETLYVDLHDYAQGKHDKVLYNRGTSPYEIARAVKSFYDTGIVPQGNGDTRFSVTMGKRAREEARAMIEKYRPDYGPAEAGTSVEAEVLAEYERIGGRHHDRGWMEYFYAHAGKKAIEYAVDKIASFDTPKERKAALYWFCKSTIRLPEDAQKVRDAIKTAERAKVDPFQFDRPGAILEQFSEFVPKEPPINPDTVPELSDRRDLGNGIVTYLVQDDKAGQAAMRRIINTHFGKDASPWCLLQGDGDGNLASSAWEYWNHYNALPKRVAFKDGHLTAFMATDKVRSDWGDEYAEEYDAYVRQGGTMSMRQYIREHKNDVPEQWWDRADESHEGIPFTHSVPAPSGEGSAATEHCELLPDGTTRVTKVTRGDPKAKDGTYEEWFPDGGYKLRETKDGEEVRFERYDENGVEREHMEKSFKQGVQRTLTIEKDYEDAIKHMEVCDGYNGMSAYQSGKAFMLYEGPGTGYTTSDTFRMDEQTARELYFALSINDQPTVDAIVADLKRRATTDTNRYGERYSVRAVGKYAGKLRRMAWGLKLAEHRAMEDAARLMAPLVPDNAVIVPMPNHEGKPISTMILAYYIAGEKDWQAGDRESTLDIVPALEAEPHESNYRHKKRTKGKSTQIVMHRTDAEIPSGRPVVIIDNVVASGATYKAAQKVLPQADLVTLADATRGRVDFDPSLQDLQKRMAENPGNLAASLNAALANPAEAMSTEEMIRAFGSRNIDEGMRFSVVANRDEAAQKFPNTKYVDADGKPRLAYHGSEHTFTDFRPSTYGSLGAGVYLSVNGEYGKDYACYINLTNPLHIHDVEDIARVRKTMFPDANGKHPFDGLAERIAAAGYDGIICDHESDEGACREILVFDPNNVLIDASSKALRRQSLSRHSVEVAPATETPAQREQMRHSIFIGLRAAFKGAADLNVLIAAETTLNKKFHDNYTPEARDEIYVNTGWWRGTDGKWRFEIRDIKPKKQGKTISEGFAYELLEQHGLRQVNGIVFDKEGVGRAPLATFVSHPQLFKAYPDLKGITVELVDPDEIDFAGQYDPNRNRITLTWDAVKWDDESGEPTNVLEQEGIETLTHELQHAVQYIEGYAKGGSREHHGERNYERLAGEVEARNAEYRIGLPFSQIVKGGVDEREAAVEAGAQPWATEDVPTSKQIIADEYGSMTDVHGRPVARSSVTRGRSSAMNAEDLVAGFIAARRLAGKETTVEEADRMLKNLGVRTAAASEVVARANVLADNNRERLRAKVERHAPDLVRTLAAAHLEDRATKAFNEAITSGAAAADPKIGIAIQRTADRFAARELQAAKGFTAAEMEAELPISLADGVFAVAEYEKSPEEKARLEEEKRRREAEKEEARRRAEEAGEEPESPVAEAERLAADETYRAPTAEERAYFDALMDRARAADEARAAEERRKKLERKKKAEEAAPSQGEDEETSADAAKAVDEAEAEEVLPFATVQRIAPVFESADLFAQFIVEWTADHIVKKHPEIPSTDEMWKRPVAVRELVKTAQHLLRDLAKDVLGSPSINHSRNLADRAINQLSERTTYNGVRAGIARIYDRIHTDALQYSRKKLVKELIYGKRGGKDADGNDDGTGFKGLRQLAGVKGRFSATTEADKRRIDAKTELWCRWLIPYLTMSEAKIQEELDRLNAIITRHDTEDEKNGYDKKNDTEYNEAKDRLALLNVYGGMIRWMPGKIIEARAAILEQVNGKRQAFEEARERRRAEDKTIRDAIIDAVNAGASAGYRNHGELADRIGRALYSLNGNLTLEMQNLIRYCKDPALRQAALRAIEEVQIIVSDGTGRYRDTLWTARDEIRRGLEAAYGNAEDGIRHLKHDTLPEDVAKKIFGQSREKLPTYGQLLQLYATTIQRDYKENAQKHGRAAQLALMEATLTDKDKMFHAWAVNWYAHNRQALSDAVEEMTGLGVSSPDRLYCPARMERTPDGFSADAVAWSPIPSALNRRVAHELDFDERVNFLDCLNEQCEVRAQTIGYGMAGIRLRNIIAHHDLQKAVNRHVGRADMKAVTDHVKDVLVQDADRKDAVPWLAPLNFARKWTARFYLSLNVPSAVKQLASMPVWANAMLDGQTIGLGRCLDYLTTVATDEGKDAMRELIKSDGFRARYKMGWSEEMENLLAHPSQKKWIRYFEKAYDKGMVVNKAVDCVSCLWMAQGFYRDAKALMERRGLDAESAKRKALALTWSACESGQQSGRIENMNRAQRHGGALVAAIFQFKTAFLLQNNYIIQAAAEVRAGTPGAKGRLARALFINTVYIPAFVAVVNAVWAMVMGEKDPPEDEETWPAWLRDFAWSMIDGVTAPLFITDSILHTAFNELFGKTGYDDSAAIPSVQGIMRTGKHAGKVLGDAINMITPFDVAEEVTAEKVMGDLLRLADDVAAPVRHVRKAIKNRMED